MHAGDNRALAWATLASLALHLVLVVGWPRVQERLRPAPSPPIVSRLVEPQPPAPEPRAPEPKRAAEPQPQAAAPKPPAEKKPPTEKKPRIEQPAPKAVQPARDAEPEPPPREAAVEAKPAAEPAQAPAAAPGPAVAAVPAPSQPPQPALDIATTIAQYRMQVLSAARRLKARYPDLARENNWSGTVVVALAVGADGAPEVRLKSGSGHAPLDEQASQMFRQAARAVPVPPALQGRAFSVELKAVYGLVD